MDINSGVNQTQSVGEILQTRNPVNSSNVSNVNKHNSNDVTTLDVNVDLEDKEQEIEYNARHVAEELHDLKSLNFYRKCFREHQATFVYQCLAITQTVEREGKIRSTPARHFVGVFKIRTGKK